MLRYLTVALTPRRDPLRQYTRTAERITARRQHLAFNLRTKRHGLTPRSLWVRPLVGSQKGRDIVRRTSRRFLMARITQNARTIRELEHDLYFQRRQLECNLRPQHASALEAVRGRAHDEVTAKYKERQKRKFDTLMGRVNAETRHGRQDDRWVVNLSSRSLSTAEKDVLARGPNFAPAPRRVPIAEIVAAVEDGLRRTSFPQAQLARTKI